MYRVRVTISLCGFIFAATASAQSLVGKWLGQKSVQEQVQCWVNHRRQDGTFELTFIQTSPSGLTRHIEEGLWLYSNGIYATITQRINGKSVDLNDKDFREFYRVESLDKRQFIYSDISSKARFQATRVPDSFVLENKCPSGA